jgi:hypothetical protein
MEFTFHHLGSHQAHPSGFFDVTLAMLPDTEELQCCLRVPGGGAVLEEKRELFGTALERANRAREDRAAAEALALRMADAAQREAEVATFAGRKALLLDATNALVSLRASIFTLSRQKCHLLQQHLQFTDPSCFDLSGGSGRKGEVLAMACSQRDDVGAVEVQHPNLGPRPPRVEPLHCTLSEEEAFASVEDLRTGVQRLQSSAERAGEHLAALTRAAVRAGLEGLGAQGAFEAWELTQLKLLKAEFDNAAAGVGVVVVRR